MKSLCLMKSLRPMTEPLPKSRAFYLKSMFFCVTPESLIPLAVVMYRKFEELRLKYLHEVYKEYDDKEKVCKQIHNPCSLAAEH